MSGKVGAGIPRHGLLPGFLQGWSIRRGIRSRRATPLTLNGTLLHMLRAVWVVMAASAVVVWVIEVPSYYSSALRLHNMSGTTNLSRAEWLSGLHALGLDPSAYALWSIVTLSFMAGSMYVAGLFIFLRRSREWIALLVSFMFVTLGAGIIVGYSDLEASALPPVLAGLLSLYVSIANSSYYLLFVVPLVFPDGRFVPRWTGVLTGLFAFLGLMALLAPGSALDMQHWPAWLQGLSTVAVGITVLISPVYRYWRVSDASQRQQTKWAVFGLVLSLAVFFFVGILTSAVPWLEETPGRAALFALSSSAIVYAVLSFLPVCFAVAIVRYRLWHIDLVLNRALVYAALTAAVAAIYILVVVGLGTPIRAAGSPALSLLATVLVAILFHPLHSRVQRGVNRLLYGDRDEPYAVLSRLGRTLEATPAPHSVLPSIVSTVVEALKLPYAAVALGHGEDLTIAASAGTPSMNLTHVPLVYQGESVGALTVSSRPGETEFSSADRHLLEELARQAGAAAYAVRLTADLQRSRERLVTAREEERRRLRRDLHDGLGPSLASVTLMADAARNLLVRDPGAAEALLGDVKAEAQAATAEIRRVVYELRPPALDELGLVPALQSLAQQYSHTGLRVSVEAPETLPVLSAAGEVAAYRIAQEAMTNVVRHAGARTCTLSVHADTHLVLEISDDGRGFSDERRGVGLTSMRERAEELGGTCVVESVRGTGTTVTARLPLAGGRQ